MGIASLPMYALPELKEHTAGWWAGLAGHFRQAGLAGVPSHLSEPKDRLGHWGNPDLMFSQTCGFPLMQALAGSVQLVATPCYGATGCRGPYYRSVIVVSSGAGAESLVEYAGGCCAVNEAGSHSGYNVLRAMVAPHAVDGHFFSKVLVSGGHRESIAMVSAGKADLAAVDCVTHGLLAIHAPDALSGTRVLCMSPEAPGLPLITAGRCRPGDLAKLRKGLERALTDPALADHRQALLINGLSILGMDSYQDILEFEGRAADHGYPAIS